MRWLVIWLAANDSGAGCRDGAAVLWADHAGGCSASRNSSTAATSTQLWHVRLARGLAHRREGSAEPGGPEAKTHCSAFVAAMAERRGAYVLRPPEHKQNLLANAQMRWLREHGAERGWRTPCLLCRGAEAANRGELVLEAFENPNPHSPAISRSCGRARRRARNWIEMVRRRPRPASRTRSAPRPRPASATTRAPGRRAAPATCATTPTP